MEQKQVLYGGWTLRVFIRGMEENDKFISVVGHMQQRIERYGYRHRERRLE